jgi:hypothetical protein
MSTLLTWLYTHRTVLLWWLGLGLLYLLADGLSMLLGQPKGIHYARQTDTLSFVANYYLGAGFFEPQVFSVNSVDGKAACEFPVLYYLTAKIWKITGQHPVVLRSLSVLVATLGYWAFFDTVHTFLGSSMRATVLALLVISSPVLMYYTFNVLPDAPALGFALIGWGFMVRYFERQRMRALVGGFFFFSISGLLKVTYFIHPIAAVAAGLWLALIDAKHVARAIGSQRSLLFALFLAALPIVAWNVFAIGYNADYGNYYFLVQSRPLWALDTSQRAEVWDAMSSYWFHSYHYHHLMRLLPFALLASLWFYRSGSRLLQSITVFVLLGSLAYFVLFFAQFRDHDYYAIAFVPGMGFLLLNTFDTLARRFKGRYMNGAMNGAVLAISVLTILHMHRAHKHRERHMERQYDHVASPLLELRESFDAAGYHPDDRVLVYTDATENGSLYFLNRKGWTVKVSDELDQEALRTYTKHGARVLVVTPEMEKPPYLTVLPFAQSGGYTAYALSSSE